MRSSNMVAAIFDQLLSRFFSQLSNHNHLAHVVQADRVRIVDRRPDDEGCKPALHVFGDERREIFLRNIVSSAVVVDV
jgi:hypothetical protein